MALGTIVVRITDLPAFRAFAARLGELAQRHPEIQPEVEAALAELCGDRER